MAERRRLHDRGVHRRRRLRWRYRRYRRRTATPRARSSVIHGIQSHGGWYEHSCTQLSQAGYDVSFLDRRGSGLNEEDRGDAPGFRRLLDDLAEFLHARCRATMPRGHTVGRLPVFLVAISWGGKLAVALERRHPGLVDGLVLLCPGFFPQVRPSLGPAAAASCCAGSFGPRKLFPIPLNDPELFTATPRWQEFLRDDPLRLHQATARLLVESVRLDGPYPASSPLNMLMSPAAGESHPHEQGRALTRRRRRRGHSYSCWWARHTHSLDDVIIGVIMAGKHRQPR